MADADETETDKHLCVLCVRSRIARNRQEQVIVSRWSHRGCPSKSQHRRWIFYRLVVSFVRLSRNTFALFLRRLKQSVSIERQLGNRYPTGTKRGKKGTHGAGRTGTPANQHWSPTLRPFVSLDASFGLFCSASRPYVTIISYTFARVNDESSPIPTFFLGCVSIIKIPSLPRHHRETTDWDT